MPEVEKRKPDRQLTKDTNDDDDADNDVVTTGIQKADAKTLQARRIVKAKRTADGKLDLSSKSKNAFAGVQLKAAAPATDSAKEGAPSIFGQTTSFSAFGGAAVTTGLGFGSGFSSNTSSNGFGSASSEKDSTNGGGGTAFSGFGGFSNKPTSGFTFGSKPASSGFGTTGSDSAAQDDDANGDEHPETAAVDSTTKPVVILPESFDLVSGEEGEVELFKGRCKAHRWGPVEHKTPDTTTTSAEATHPSVPPSKSGFETKKSEATSPTAVTGSDEKDETSKSATAAAESSDEPTEKWHELGVGPLKILTNHKTGAARLVQRRECTPGGAATKVLLNARPAAVTNPSEFHAKVTCVETSNTDPQPKLMLVLFKFKEAVMAAECRRVLAQVIEQMKKKTEEEKKSLEETETAVADEKEDATAEAAETEAPEEKAPEEAATQDGKVEETKEE